MRSAATATIAASDPITVTLTGPTTVDEGDATTNYTVSLTPAGVLPTAALTVSVRDLQRHGGGRHGLHGQDRHPHLYVRRAAGSQTFTVQTTEDTLDEGTGETFTVSIASPARRRRPGADA